MNVVHLLPVGDIEEKWLRDVKDAIPGSLHASCEILPVRLDPAPAFHGERQQYHSSEMLQRMQRFVSPRTWRLLGVAEVDLYIPILQYVFGEAQMGGPCALISGYRLRQEFYGLPPDDALFRERLRKEALHELGHTLGLRHCQDYRCAMASAHAVEWIDLRENSLCASCQTRTA